MLAGVCHLGGFEDASWCVSSRGGLRTLAGVCHLGGV